MDDHNMLFRRFGFLQKRVLLYKQYELRELEKKLDKLDRADKARDQFALRYRSSDDIDSPTRNNYIGIARSFAELEIPRDTDYQNVRTYFDREKPLYCTGNYIDHHEDIVTLNPSRETTWLDTFVKRTLEKLYDLARKPLKEGQLKANEAAGLVIYSRRRIDVVVTLIVLTMIIILFIIPVYIIWRLTRNTQAANSISGVIEVMLAFTVVFSLALMKFTKAKQHEILAAAAGYCAVLVTFLGNIG